MTTIKTARSENIYHSLEEAIEKLDSYNFKLAEIFSVFYKPSYSNDVQVISAVGLGNGNYKVITSIPYPILLDIQDTDPGAGNRDGIMWRDTNRDWHFGDSLIEDPILVKDTSENYLSLTTEGPKNWGDTFTNAELDDKLSESLISVQADWNSDRSPQAIKNKPQNLNDFVEDILYTISETEPGIYSLKKNGYDISTPIPVPPNKTLESGELVYNVEDNNFYLNLYLAGGDIIEAPLYNISKTYVSGDGIEIKDNTCSLKTEYINESLQFSIPEVSIEEPGYMTPTDKKKLNSLNDNELIDVRDLEGGSIQPKKTDYSYGINGSDGDTITTSEKSAGKLPTLRVTGGENRDRIETGKAQLLELYGNINADFLISTSYNAVIIDRHLWAFVLKRANIENNIIVPGDNVVVWFWAVPDVEYTLESFGNPPCLDIVARTDSGIPEFGTSVTVLGHENGNYSINTSDSAFVLSLKTREINERTIRAYINYAIPPDLGYRNSRLYLNCPNSWGSRYMKVDDNILYDRWFSKEDDILYYEQKIGRISIQETNWGPKKYDPEEHYYYYETEEIVDIKPRTTNIQGIQGVWVTEDKKLRTEDTLNSLGTLLYELETPRTYNLGISASYNAWKYGTEAIAEFRSDAGYYLPFRQNIKGWKTKHKEDLTKTLYEIPDLTSDIDTPIDSFLSDTSENMVSGFYIKEYIDTKIASVLDTIKDVSKYNVFGEYLNVINSANSYVIKEPGNYKLPLIYGNAIRSDRTNENALKINGSYAFKDYTGTTITNPWIPQNYTKTVSIVWTDCPNAISNLHIENNYLYFKVEKVPLLNGNTVLAVHDENNNIVWSWHIWLCQDDLTPIKITNIDYLDSYYYVLPENLGTVWDSLDRISGSVVFYQWGRKDPFSPAQDTGSTISLVNITVDSGYSVPQDTIKNPGTFYTDYIPDTINAWNTYTNSQDSYYFYKSIFDPCPFEFFVPDIHTFAYFTETGTSSTDPSEFNVLEPWDNLGWKFKEYDDDTLGLFMPAAGERTYNTGNLYNPTTHIGSYWCNKQKQLQFSDSYLYMETGGNFGTAKPIRPQYQ